jgi:hypothetical protein
VAEDKLIDKLLLDEEVLLLDKDNKTFYYSLIEGDSTAYNPYVSIEASNSNVRLSFCGEKITKESIRNNECIKVIAYDDDYYEEYYLRCTTLPLMNIECSTDLDNANKTPMQMYLYDNREDVRQRSITSKGTIHLRGDSSLVYPKNAYRLSLTCDDNENNDVSLLGMRKDDDWILYQAYNDQEKVRNVFSTNLWKYTCAQDNSLGVDNGLEYKYIELFLNGEYWGLYALGYPLDELQLEIDEEKGEQLYKKLIEADEAEISLAPGADTDGYETKFTGDNKWDLLNQYYLNLSREWNNAESLYEGIDIDNSIDASLFVNLVQGLDQVNENGSFKNMYLAFKNVDGKKVVLYTPWDLDITWGNVYTGELDTNLSESYGIDEYKNVIKAYGNLEALIANNDEQIWNLILAKYHSLREGLWSLESLNGMIDEYEDDIYGSGAFRRDMERWPDGTYNDPDEGLDAFREYVAKRLEKLDEYYDESSNNYLFDDGTRISDSIDRFILLEDLGMEYELYEWRNVLEKYGYGVVVEISNHDVIYNDGFQKFVDNLGISNGDITEDTDFLVVDNNGNHSIVNTGHNSGDRNGTVLGELSVFYNEFGGYGVYLDGEDCIIETDPTESSYADVRVAIMDLAKEKIAFRFSMIF